MSELSPLTIVTACRLELALTPVPMPVMPSPHFSQPCALGRFDGRRSSQVAQAADSADFGQAPASALEQGACGRVDGV